MKRMASARKSSKSNASSRKRVAASFVVCLRNDDYLASLELRKLYRVLRDSDAEKHGLIRIIDESGEDYLYPSEYFAAVRLPQSVGKAVLRVG